MRYLEKTKKERFLVARKTRTDGDTSLTKPRDGVPDWIVDRHWSTEGT